MASASISTNISEETRWLTSTNVHAGRIRGKCLSQLVRLLLPIIRTEKEDGAFST